MGFVGRSLLFPAVKEFWKSVKNGKSYRYEFGVQTLWVWCTTFFGIQRGLLSRSYLFASNSVGPSSFTLNQQAPEHAICYVNLWDNKITAVQGYSGLSKVVFLPRDAMHSADYAVARCLSIFPFVCPSHAGIMSQRLNISPFFSPSGSYIVLVFFTSNAIAIFRLGTPPP